MPIYKRCSRCGKRMLLGLSCDCIKTRHREYDCFTRDQKAKAFYASSDWERIRSTVLELDEWIDVYVYMTKGEIVAADTVHHIVPLRDDWSKRCSVDNLMSLRHDTHSLIEKLYKEDKDAVQEQLRKMLCSYRNERVGGI